jgi:sugar O-acyltransferase (sialic acid O-acetyltransferase NeuD family)
MRKRALVGAGGFAREIKAHMKDSHMVCFVDDSYWSENDDNILPLSKFDPYEYDVLVAIGDSKQRSEMVSKLPPETSYFSFVHETALILSDDVSIGEGSIVCAGSVITTNVNIGRHAHINLNTTIGHDCNIGDYFTTAPGVNLSGNCVIGSQVYLGTNCSVRQRVHITDKVTVGLNSGVVTNLIKPGTYVGLPAKMMNKRKKLSIVITCYNFEKYISKCIDSVLEQKTDFETEVIVADDCSKDSSYDIIKTYGDRVRHYRNDENLGCFENFKKALEMAEGDYVSHLDGDDFLIDPLKSQKQVDFLERNPSYSMHSTGCIYGNEDGTLSQTHIVPLQEVVTDKELANNNIVGFGRTFRNYKNLVKEWMREVYYLDWCVNVELSLNGMIKCESWQSGVYRLTGEGMITGMSNSEIELLNIKCRDALKRRIEYHKYEL